MAVGTVFINNRTQAVRLPAELRLPDEVKRVNVRAVGKERILSPVGHAWDSFFLSPASLATDDFMQTRDDLAEQVREDL